VCRRELSLVPKLRLGNADRRVDGKRDLRKLSLVPKLRLGNALPGKLQLRLTVNDSNDCMVFYGSRLLTMR
jgi:hypothetical protein